MRIAIVCPYAWDRPGGVQSHVRSLAPALGTRGHEVRVFAPASGSRRQTGIAEGDEPTEVSFVGRAVGIPANGSVAPICFGPVAAARIRRELARFGPTVVHLHEPLIPSVSLLALASLQVPAVGTFHAAASTSALYRTFRGVLTPCYRRLTAATAVSPAAASLVERYFPGDLPITPNGIDVATFRQAEPAALDPGPHVLFIGRLEPRKGASVAIDAMAAVKDLGARLLIAGEGRLRPRLEQQAARLDVDVRFLGAVPDDTKARLLRACTVYCAPNLGGESFGIVLLEAMASGCPVVCADLPAFRSVAQDAALFFDPGSTRSLAEKLRLVVSDRKAADARVARGTERAARFDWSRLLPELERILGEASSRR